jgi:hypothetical protein
MPNIKQCIESQLKIDSNGIGVMSIRALCSPPEGYAPAPVSCPIWGMPGEYGRLYNIYNTIISQYSYQKNAQIQSNAQREHAKAHTPVFFLGCSTFWDTDGSRL